MNGEPKDETKKLPARLEDIEDRWEDNVPGIYYVDKSCLFCGLAEILAPKNFAMSKDDTHCRVIKQPTTPAEFEACESARVQCHVQSIQRIGDS